MEYVAGKTLSETISPKGLETQQVVHYARQIVASLAKAHASGVVHRDLKPANIMVNTDGMIKVLDFGIAKLHEPNAVDEDALTAPKTAPGVILGTAAYMSPSKPWDARSMRAQTFSRLAWCCTKCFLGGARSTAKRPCQLLRRSCTKSRVR